MSELPSSATKRSSIAAKIEQTIKSTQFDPFLSDPEWREVIAALRSESATQGWIPVSQRMPPAHKPILIACSNELISTGFWSDLGRFRLDAEDDSDGANWIVTHWIPLPEAPHV